MVFISRSISSYASTLLVLLMFCSGLFFVRCANTMAPGGGPRDSIAPTVVLMTPSFGTKNFTSKRIIIEFDEYIKLKDQQKEFYTSPLMKRKPSLMIKGKSIQIDIKDTLLENTTYALNFGSSVSDNNEGNPLNNLRYVFSTGDEIDSLVMSGMTVDGYSKDSIGKAYVYFFPVVIDTLPDSILVDSNFNQHDSLMFIGSPSVVGRSEGNGLFFTRNLKPVDYWVYALSDKNGNQTYEPGVDYVGFLDSIVNPSELPGFNVWYDTIRNYLISDPQVQIRLFLERQNKRQNLTSFKRPEQHRIEFMFGASYPIIEELVLDGIDSSDIIREYVTTGRDTMNLWLNVPAESLPDTIKGHIKYMKHDSVGVLQLEYKDLNLFWKHIESKEEKKEREKREKELESALEDGKDSLQDTIPKPNLFKYNVVEGGATLNPLKHIEIKFDSPLVSIDSSRIRVLRLGDDDKRFIVDYKLEQDSIDIRTWRIKAKWLDGKKYDLLIPSGVFRNVKGYENDTLKSEFTIYNPSDFATLVLDIKGETPESNYIIQLLGSSGNMEQYIPYAKSGEYTFKYIDAGTAKIRIVADVNGNGLWDRGDLLNRLQPEKVEVWMADNGDEEIVTKVNWTNELTIDMRELFAPKTMERMQRELRLKEEVRLRKKALEDSKIKVRKPLKSDPEDDYNPAFEGAIGNDRNDDSNSNFNQR